MANIYASAGLRRIMLCQIAVLNTAAAIHTLLIKHDASGIHLIQPHIAVWAQMYKLHA